MNRGKAYTRRMAYVKAKRKRDITLKYGDEFPWYNNLHQYSKNKIHCSCAICSAKSKNKSPRRRGFVPAYNWQISDKRKLDSLKDSLNEVME